MCVDLTDFTNPSVYVEYAVGDKRLEIDVEMSVIKIILIGHIAVTLVHRIEVGWLIGDGGIESELGKVLMYGWGEELTVKALKLVSTVGVMGMEC